jgi:oxygen-independent coproporphyrinogen-3 oxidase
MPDLVTPPLSLYIHTPYCVQKCPYCDFNSHRLRGDLPENEYIDALCAEWDLRKTLIGDRPIHSIFIGGGTPSLFSPAAYERLFKHIQKRQAFDTQDDKIEITLEANPGASDEARFACYRALGINRLSLGVQSFSNSALKLLGRIHDADAAHRAIDALKRAGFTRFNLDLMYGLSEQEPTQALEDLKTALSHQPPHLSWYQLTLEPNTAYHHSPPPLPDDDELFSIQEAGLDFLQKQAYHRYEISAFCLADQVEKHKSQHNLNYWQFGDYLGLGAGAHSKLTLTEAGQNKIYRFQNQKHPRLYQDNLTPGMSPVLELSRAFEFMLNHLRLLQDLDLHLFEERTGLRRSVIYPNLREAESQGFLNWDENHIKLTAHGVNFLNDVIGLFLR